MAIHNITVGKWDKWCPIRKKTHEFALLNNNELCGDRLCKNSQAWPFTTSDWMFHATKESAEKAAKKLRAYLAKAEPERAKTKKIKHA